MYYGNTFTIEYDALDQWRIYRHHDNGEVSQVFLPPEAMDELRDYFACYYKQDRVLAEIEAKKSG